MNQLIAHYVHSDNKFASGYIFFMNNVMKEYKHIFITNKKTNLKSNVEDAKMLFITKSRDILVNKEVRSILGKCDKFIISGVFSNTSYVSLLPQSILRKTYLHFWGADFYDLRDVPNMSYFKKNGLKLFLWKRIYHVTKKILLRRCAAVITLIEEDYDELTKISGINKYNFTAPMPGDGSGKKYILNNKNIKKKSPPYLILVGNSATKTNRHIEALSLLEKYSNEDINIICPLSYGDKEYAKQVLEYGRKIFGTKFISLDKFIPKDEYIEMLARVEVAVFNNDRQQGMGNISKLLSMGCKLYLREDTSMWKAYLRRSYSLYSINNINEEDFSTFISFPVAKAKKNNKVFEKITDPSIRYTAWKRVFDYSG